MIITDTIHTDLFPQHSISCTLIRPDHCTKTLFWLHGYQERAAQLLEHQEFMQISQQYHTAIVFPDVPDSYYLNQSWNRCYTEDFLISRFLPAITLKYDLPRGRDVTFLAGISMGGFGSLLLGSHHPEHFGKIGCISGAFIIDDVLIGNPEITGPASNLSHFQHLLGDLPSLEEDPDRNPVLAAREAAKAGWLPAVHITCGTGDLLYPRNQKVCCQLAQAGADVTWTEGPGDHHWDFFAPAVLRMAQWLYQES